jgi:hypothetical protein
MWKISFLVYCRSGGIIQIWTRRRSSATTVCLVDTVPRILFRYYWICSCMPYLSFQEGHPVTSLMEMAVCACWAATHGLPDCVFYFTIYQNDPDPSGMLTSQWSYIGPLGDVGLLPWFGAGYFLRKSRIDLPSIIPRAYSVDALREFVHTHPASSSTPSCSNRARYSHSCFESLAFGL